MDQENFKIKKKLCYSKINKGKITVKSPSNIALIKYWGKSYNQIPCNPSISYRLNQCYSETTLYYQYKKNKKEKFSVEFFF